MCWHARKSRIQISNNVQYLYVWARRNFTYPHGVSAVCVHVHQTPTAVVSLSLRSISPIFSLCIRLLSLYSLRGPFRLPVCVSCLSAPLRVSRHTPDDLFLAL